MLRQLSFLLACGLAAATPLLPGGGNAPCVVGDFPGWPASLEGRVLQERPLGERERRFARYFPGKIGRFGDGRSEWVVRWVEGPTRRLHSAVDCYRGLGFSITSQDLVSDSEGVLWGSFCAIRADERYAVRERIHDSEGGNWTDVSSWYWSAATGASTGPWWALTRVRRCSDD